MAQEIKNADSRCVDQLLQRSDFPKKNLLKDNATGRVRNTKRHTGLPDGPDALSRVKLCEDKLNTEGKSRGSMLYKETSERVSGCRCD